MSVFTPSQKAYIWLTSYEKLSCKQLCGLLKLFDSAVELVKNFKKSKSEIENITGSELYNLMLCGLNPGYMQPILDKLLEKGIDIITINDENYPQELLQVEDPPHILYAIGDISLLKNNLITVVGSRKCTRYGEQQTENIVKGLCDYGFTIISGLAEGIDTVANFTALKCGKTIAVVAGGFDHIYPSVNEKLFNEIAKNGLVLSEYPPHTEIMPYMFPLRNRIMAALCVAAVVTEAGEKSGAIITANLALNLGKELFVLPGNVNSQASTGCNKLIKEMQGAFITCYEDILNNLGIETKIDEKNIQDKQNKDDLSDIENTVTELLKRGDMHIDELLIYTHLSIKEANALLSVMEIKGIIKKLPGNYYGI